LEDEGLLQLALLSTPDSDYGSGFIAGPSLL